MVSTNTMSRSRLRRWATEPNTSAAISGRASSRKSIAAYAASSVNPGQPAIATRCATQPVAASFDPGSHARCATSANTTRSTCSPSRRRPTATRRIAAPIPRRSQIRSSVHAAPNRRESSTSTPPPGSPAPTAVVAVVAVTACSGVRNREIDDTNRASAARSTVSARPKLWITFATGFPLTGCRSLCASCR